MDLISVHKMYCNRRTRVIPAPGKSTKRVLLEFSYIPDKLIEDELTIETEIRHMYTNKFKNLVHEFYLG
jgi:tRNA1(Val) A37 N6-methylase TrmN6